MKLTCLFLSHACRKVADVRREKELAERRKNEPQLGSTQDHLVRKIFSKFRRAQQTAQLTKEGSQNSDVEKGDTDQETKKVRNTLVMRLNKSSSKVVLVWVENEKFYIL